MTEIVSPRSVAFGCVAEPTPRFYNQVMRLVQSIRWFGGSLADADVFICFVGEVETARRVEFEALGAQVRVVELFNPLNRFSNKVRFLELPELAHYQTAVLLDCDMALVQDPAPYIVQPALQLMIADLPTVPSERLARLCAHFGLVTPATIYRTTCSQEPTIWYCNTGVMILPTAWIGRILPAWRDFILQLCAEPTLLDPPYNHCNQAAMTLTYIANPLPYAELPVAMNFPLHQTGRRPAEALLREDPVILHYHDRVDADGLLLSVPYPLAQARIQMLNERLRASRHSRPAALYAQPCVDGPPVPSSACSRASAEEHLPMPFIIGASHSGTALLRLILVSHPELAIPAATHFIPDIARACQRAAYPAERFVEALIQQVRWPDFQIDAGHLRAATMARDPFTVGDGLRAFYRLYAARFGKPRYGDHTPAYGLCAAQIQMLLPEARFIHLIRDGRDVALAHRQVWAKSHPLAEMARHWAAWVHATRRQAHELQHYLEVRYEDFLLEPELALRRICEYLQLNWDPAMLATHQRAINRLGTTRRSFHSAGGVQKSDEQRIASKWRLSRGPQPQRAGVWRRELSPGDLATVESEAGGVLEQLGYRLTSGRIAKVWPRVAVCITGMHRSGTSLVGQILHSCGPYLGPYRRLAVPAADNLDGYWEHPDFHRLNDAILAYFGGGWDLTPSLPANWADLPELEPLRQRARALIRQFDDQRFWGWKDPRSALTMPFWRRLIPGLKVVICVRNPLEVAQSLSRCGMSSLRFGLCLWQTYYERLLASVPPQDRIVTCYDAYFVDAAAETKRVLDWLRIPSSPEIIRRACRVASNDLRHHHDTTADLLDTEVSAAVLQLYSQLCVEAPVPELAADTNRTQSTAPAPRVAGTSVLLEAREPALAALRAALATRQTELAILRPVLEAREAEVALLQPTLAAREAEIAGLTGELQSTRDLLATREAEIAGFARELQSTRDLLAAREAEIAGFARELQSRCDLLMAREAEIAALTGELRAVREQHTTEADGIALQE